MDLSPGVWLLVLATMVFGYAFLAFGFGVAKPPALRKRLRDLVLPKLELVDVTVAQALNALTTVVAKNDPNGIGIRFFINSCSDERASFFFDRQSTWDVLEGICLTFSLHYHLDAAGNQVELFLPSGEIELMERRYVPPAAVFPTPWATNFQDVFVGLGIPFPPGASATYENRVLVVAATENVLNLLEKIYSLDPISDETS